MKDWTDLAYYKKKRKRADWAWEFMRRNASYRADYEKVAYAWKSAPRQGHLYIGEQAYEAERLGRALGAKWSQLGPLTNFELDTTPKFLPSGPIAPDGDEIDVFYEDVGTGVVQQSDHYATLTFDIRRPIQPQLRRAREQLAKRRSKVKAIKPIRSSEHWWPFYLLILDAKEVDASNAEIAAKIPSIKNLKDKYEASKRVSAYYKRARELRDNPLAILL